MWDILSRYLENVYYNLFFVFERGMVMYTRLCIRWCPAIELFVHYFSGCSTYCSKHTLWLYYFRFTCILFIFFFSAACPNLCISVITGAALGSDERNWSYN